MKILLTVILQLVFAIHVLADNQHENPVHLTETTDEMINLYLEKDLFSGTVLISENGVPFYNKAFGFASIENKTKNELDTKFKIASIGKMFTMTAVLKLAEMGYLKLDDNIGKHIKDFSEDILDKVTIRQLLRHEAGFGDFLRIPAFNQNPKSFKKVSDLINIIKRESLLFEPGTNNSYSNSGFVVLGAVIESVTKKSYFEAIEEIILIPLGLENTFYRNTETITKKATGYIRNLNGKSFITLFDVWPSPAGDAFSTVEDLHSFVQNLFFNNNIFTNKSKVLFINNFKMDNSTEWNDLILNENEKRLWAGGAPGISSSISLMLAKKYVVVVLSNYDSPIAIEIAQEIASIIENGNYNKPKIKLSELLFQTYQENGSDYIKKNFNDLISGYRLQGPPSVVLNQLGYSLMMMERNIQDAIEIFTINTKLFPNDGNAFDSLAEAHLNYGNNKMAIKYYRKAIELNPDNVNAIEMLKQLKL